MHPAAGQNKTAEDLGAENKTVAGCAVLLCTQPAAREYGKTEIRKRKRILHPTTRVGQDAFAPSRVQKALWDKTFQDKKKGAVAQVAP